MCKINYERAREEELNTEPIYFNVFSVKQTIWEKIQQQGSSSSGSRNMLQKVKSLFLTQVHFISTYISLCKFYGDINDLKRTGIVYYYYY